MKNINILTYDQEVPRQLRGRLRWLTFFCILLSLAMLAGGVLALVATRLDTWQQAQKEAGNISLALDRDINRMLSNYDKSIIGAGEIFLQPGLDKVPEPFRQAALYDRTTVVEYINRVLIANATGDIVSHQGTDALPAANIGDREYFLFHKTHPHGGMFISRAIQSRFVNDLPILGLSRRLSAPDGQFVGVVSVGLRLTYFHDLFSKLSLGTQGVITLIRDDGYIVARFPSKAGYIDRNLTGGPIFEHFKTGNAGEYVGESQTDGVRRLYVFRHVGAFPLIIVVGFAVEDIYQVWKKRALVIGSVLAAFAAATLGLCFMFRSELLRRIQAEENMAEVASRLSVMASTDGLTGLANRRAWEAQFATAWKRAYRDQKPLAVLMIDVDHFKLYNDRHGHQEGDTVLRMVGKALTHCLSGPDGFAARYGGEEFAVLLPATDNAGAEAMAESIRRAVFALGLIHVDSSTGRISVSVGAASIVPGPGDTPSQIMRLADNALYEAKQRGRNGVILAGSTSWTTKQAG